LLKLFIEPRKSDLFYQVPDRLRVLNQYHTSVPMRRYTHKSAHIEVPHAQMRIDVHEIIGSDWLAEEEQHNTDLPYFPKGILKLIHDFGYSMLLDDRHDIGRFSYTDRPGYPPHPSGIHHWYMGALLMIAAQLGGMASKMKEFMEAGMEIAGGLPLSGLAEAPPLVATKVRPAPLQNQHMISSQRKAIPYNPHAYPIPSLPLLQPTNQGISPILQDNTQTQPQSQQRSKSVQVPNPLRNIIKH
jgi:hypothetical protein